MILVLSSKDTEKPSSLTTGPPRRKKYFRLNIFTVVVLERMRLDHRHPREQRSNRTCRCQIQSSPVAELLPPIGATYHQQTCRPVRICKERHHRLRFQATAPPPPAS